MIYNWGQPTPGGARVSLSVFGGFFRRHLKLGFAHLGAPEEPLPLVGGIPLFGGRRRWGWRADGAFVVVVVVLEVVLVVEEPLDEPQLRLVPLDDVSAPVGCDVTVDGDRVGEEARRGRLAAWWGRLGLVAAATLLLVLLLLHCR